MSNYFLRKNFFAVTFLRVFVLVFLSSAFIAAAYADKAIKVDRVRWKKSLFVWVDHEDYPEWKNEGIWTEYRKRTYVAKYWNPGSENARNLVILIAGQQGSSGLSGCSNCLTGQDSDWDEDWGAGDKSKTAYLKDQSLSGRLIDSGYFNQYDTFFSVVFNSNFNWENTKDAKEKAERAFTNWFLKHGDSGRVEKIFLLGSSRGGALAMRMAKKILEKTEWSTTPVYVGILDAVPNTEQDELNTSGQPKCYNPYNIDYYSRKADLPAFFDGMNKPNIRHIITGAPVLFDFMVHSFCADEQSWYIQSWVDLEHTQIGRCVDDEGADYNDSYMSEGIVKLYEWILSHM